MSLSSHNLPEQVVQNGSESHDTIQPQGRSFENSFWGKDDRGVEALMNKMRKAKQTCADLRTMISARAALEEEYGKKLIKIAKSDICKDETGEMQKSLSRVRVEMESTGNAHVELGQRIRADIDSHLGSFIGNQRERRKAQAAIIEKSSKSKSLKHANLLKIKEKYLSEKAKASALDLTASSNGSKDAEKAHIRQFKMKELEQEYNRLSEELEEATKIWQHDWRVSCRLFQELEEERIEFIKKMCWDYANIVASICLRDDESCEKIRGSLQNILVEQEIQAFIEERGTGYDPDYETDGSPICEIPALDSPLDSSSSSGFHMSSPANFIKKAFHRPQSFASTSSLFSSSSGSKSKSQAKRSSGIVTAKSSTDDIKPNRIPNNDSVSNIQSNPLSGASKGSLTSFYEEQDAPNQVESSSALNHIDVMSSPPAMGLQSTSSISSVHRAPEPAAPEAPSPGTQPLFFVRAIYDYLREMELEMTITTGQVIAVLATHDDGWWEGEYVDGSTGIVTRGIFPSNFTRKLE